MNEMKKAMIWLFYALLWELSALLVNKAIILPSFSSVIILMSQQLFTSTLYISLGTSLFRVIIGTSIALVLALTLSLLAESYPKLKPWFRPLVLISKTIPNITYILIILIWFSREMTVSIITLLILFPVLYSHISLAIETTLPEYRDLHQLFPERYTHRLREVILPLIRVHLIESIQTAISLGFKVGVMAELLGQVQPGLGYQLYLAKLDLNTTALFAYTGWMIITVILAEKLIGLLRKE
jgi:NitT/TauT family transport system permease protein